VARYRLSVEYDGRGFEGWQLQPGGHRTVQGALHEALARVTGEAARAVGAGRTDAGVHAEGQVAGVALERDVDPVWLRRALNGVLPADVAVTACEPAAEGFHARYDARSKLYRYHVWNGPERSPLRAARSHWVRTPLDVAAMRRAARLLEGTHDFRAFQAAGSEVRTTQRTLLRLELRGAAGGDLELWVEGDGFLRHMVRIVAGTLIEVGLGRREAGSMPGLLATRERRRAGRTAPGHALCLVRVSYGASGEGPQGARPCGEVPGDSIGKPEA
jgi:tRNA pseudouridine38-40 synthase